MKLHGKVVGKEIKDYGKGKDATAQEVGFVTVRLDGGHGGKLIFEPGEEEFPGIDLGDKATVSIDFSQQKLDLNRRAASQREGAAKPH
jgi:hypothetical protein